MDSMPSKIISPHLDPLKKCTAYSGAPCTPHTNTAMARKRLYWGWGTRQNAVTLV